MAYDLLPKASGGFYTHQTGLQIGTKQDKRTRPTLLLKQVVFTPILRVYNLHRAAVALANQQPIIEILMVSTMRE